MKLLRRIIVEKRVAIASIAIAIAANLAAYLAIVYPMKTRVESGEARVQAATRAEREAARQLAGAKTTQAGKQTTENQLRTFYAQVLPDNLADARRAAYLRLVQLAAQSNVRYERQSTEKVALKGSDLTRLTLIMVLDGSYEDLRRFIHAIETAPEFLVIDDMTLATRSEPNASLVLTLTVSTYYRERNAT